MPQFAAQKIVPHIFEDFSKISTNTINSKTIFTNDYIKIEMSWLFLDIIDNLASVFHIFFYCIEIEISPPAWRALADKHKCTKIVARKGSYTTNHMGKSAKYNKGGGGGGSIENNSSYYCWEMTR